MSVNNKEFNKAQTSVLVCTILQKWTTDLPKRLNINIWYPKTKLDRNKMWGDIWASSSARERETIIRGEEIETSNSGGLRTTNDSGDIRVEWRSVEDGAK